MHRSIARESRDAGDARIYAPGLDKPLEITLIREEITLEDVTYAGFVEPGTAYFRRNLLFPIKPAKS